MKVRKKKLLLVEWGDANSSTRWTDEDDLIKETLMPIISVGWRMKSKGGVLTLASMRAENRDCSHKKLHNKYEGDRMTKKFRLSGQAVFHAKDIDDAFKRLSKHFDALYNDRDSDLFEPGTDLHIEPVKEPE